MIITSPASTELACCISGCGSNSGLDVICRFHRKTFRQMSDYMKTKVMIVWHDIICNRAYVEGRGYKCHHCLKYFERDEVCGDHYPDSKGACPEKKFNILAGVCSCKFCNQSDSPTRQH